MSALAPQAAQKRTFPNRRFVPKGKVAGSTRIARACTHKSRLFGNRWLPQTTCAGCARRRLRRFSAAVATSREGHRQQGSGREGQHRRWGRFNRHNALRPFFAMKLVRNISARLNQSNPRSTIPPSKFDLHRSSILPSQERRQSSLWSLTGRVQRSGQQFDPHA